MIERAIATDMPFAWIAADAVYGVGDIEQALRRAGKGYVLTDAVLDEVVTWQQQPLDPVYPLVFFDALRVKICDEGMVRNKAIHIALGVRADSAKEVLGL